MWMMYRRDCGYQICRTVVCVIGLSVVYRLWCMVSLNIPHDTTIPETEAADKLDVHRERSFALLEDVDAVAQEQDMRLKTLSKACDVKYPDEDGRSEHRHTSVHGRALLRRSREYLQVLDEYQTIFCLVPKAGSTNMLTMFVNISTNGTDQGGMSWPMHSEEKMAKYGVRPLRNYTAMERVERLKKYYKVIMVRNPYTRWLSGYTEKFYRHHNDTSVSLPLGKDIISLFRVNASQDSLARGHDVRFTEFVQLLLYSIRVHDFLNSHWAPYEELCAPCQIKYDFILKLETIDNDMKYIRHKVFRDNIYTYMPPSYSSYTDMEKAKAWWNTIPVEEKEQLLSYYRHEFNMFSYGTSLENS